MSSQREHGTLKSYVIGFVLSLVLTLIPYYLVVNQKISGTTLQTTILVFAFVQMLIQMIFFLHLGRGPKPKWNLFFFASTVGVILIVVAGSIVIIDNLHYNMQTSDLTKKLITDEGIYQVGGKKTGACYGQHANHIVTITNEHVSPVHTKAKLCDTLTFSNKGSEIVDIAFSQHPQHLAYAGETDIIVKKGQNKTITLSELGTYTFHDHLKPEAVGNFSVAP